jgi:hypothetical protein
MKTESVVFLDIPAFPPPDNKVLNEDPDLIKRLVISDRVRDWHRKGNPTDDMPPRSIGDVKAYRRTTQRVQFASAIGRFFSFLKKGDVIVVPPQSFEDDILFGELMDEPNIINFVDSPDYLGEKIPCRRVEWKARKKRQDAPLWLTRKIASPNPLRQFERRHQEYVYDLMYERYYFDGKFACKIEVKSTDFSSLDNFLIQQLILYPVALRESAYIEEMDEFNPEDPISVTISKIKFFDEIPDQRISISSPGHIVVYARNLLPLIIGVMISTAAAVPVDAVSKPLPKVVVVNSADQSSTSKKCQSDVAAEVDSDINAMGYSRWRELCLIEFEARKRTDLSPGMPTTITRSKLADK